MNVIKNVKAKKALQDRWNELGIDKMSEVVRDANERYPNMKITKERLSKWISKSTSLSENQVIWLLIRYHIPVSTTIGYPSVDSGGVLKYKVPKYDELEALNMLKSVFPKVTDKAEEIKPIKKTRNGKK